MEKNHELHTDESGFLPFDPVVLVTDVLRRWVLILLITVAVGIGGYIVTDYTYTPVYKTTATFVVTDPTSTATVFGNLSKTQELASVFSELLNSSLLHRSVLAEIGETSFQGSVKTSVIPETNLITMTVTASNPRTAYLMAQGIIKHHHTITYQVVDDISLEVLQSPSIPTSPSNFSNASGTMKKAATLAAAASCLLLAFRSYTQDKIRSGKEARKKLDCKYLGDIPHETKYKTLRAKLERSKTSILISSPLTGFRFRENIRKLRSRVDRLMQGKKVLMVTSLLENEGKSTVAVNLALSMAQKYDNTLLIECDLRKPACYKLLNQSEPEVGLLAVLKENASFSDAIIPAKQGNLQLLLESNASKNSSELLASAKMTELLQWARETYDVVILDMPPIAAITDIERVKDLADASLLVVRHNTAVTPALNKAIALLNGGKAKLLGCVLNNVYSTGLTSGYGYGYGYGYGGYGKYGHYHGYGPKK